MAKMAMVASALNEYSQGKAPPQKSLSDSRGEFFAALLKSPPEQAGQKLVLLPAATLSPQARMNSNAHSRQTMPRNSEPRQSATPDAGSSDDNSQNLLVPTAQNLIVPTASTLTPAADSSDVIGRSTDSAAVKKSCENAKDKINSTDTKALASTDPAAPAMLWTPTMPLMPAAPTVTVANASVNVTGQTAGQMTDMRADAASSDSANPDDLPESALAKTIDPLTFQFAGKPTATAQSIPPGDPTFDKAIASSSNITATAPSIDPASQLISFTSTPAAPIQPTATEAPLGNMPSVQESANTAMADTNRAVALRVSRAIRSGEDTLTIELHPAELGHVAVHIAFHANGVDVQMFVGREETYKAFSQDRAALEQQFSQAGIDLGAGGLDLRHNPTPAPEPKQTWTPASPEPSDGGGETEARTVFLGDNLVNIVA